METKARAGEDGADDHPEENGQQTRESVRKQRGHSLAAATPHLFMLERNRGKVRIGKGFPNQIILFSLTLGVALQLNARAAQYR